MTEARQRQSEPKNEPRPMPANLRSVQPGGGVCYRVELAWRRWRRWYLKHFRLGYVRRMAALRQGSPDGAPHEVLDPRDLKYCQNQCTCRWRREDDPFVWRDRLKSRRVMNKNVGQSSHSSVKHDGSLKIKLENEL